MQITLKCKERDLKSQLIHNLSQEWIITNSLEYQYNPILTFAHSRATLRIFKQMQQSQL